MALWECGGEKWRQTCLHFPPPQKPSASCRRQRGVRKRETHKVVLVHKGYNMIDICLLGTCGMMPLPGRWLSCVLVRSGATLTLFDCGEGTQIPWKSLGWGFRQLGAICFSHMHADHVAGLPGILFMVAHAGRTEPLDIYGPVGTAYVVEGLRRIAAELPFPIHIHELRGGESVTLPGELDLTCASAAHG